MELEDLSREDLLILTRSIMCGSTPAEAIAALIPERHRDTIIALHTILCSQPHNADGCQFYNEQNWTDHFHSYWIGLVGKILSKFDIDITQLSKMLPYLIEVAATRGRVLKEEGEKGVELFNYLLQLKDL
jgi:hypothetical protein